MYFYFNDHVNMPFKRSFKRKSSFAKKKWTPGKYKKKSFRAGRKFSRASTYRKNKHIAKSIKTIAETKKIVGQELLNQVPIVTVPNSKVYSYYYDFANAAPNPFGTALDCTTIAQGVGADERTGNYAYLKNIQGALRIAMTTPVDSSTPEFNQPVRFKAIFFKQKRVYAPAGVQFDPTEDIFLTPGGDKTGPGREVLGVQSMSTLQFFAAPFNTRNFKIGMVKNFTLGPPMNLGDNAHAGMSNSQSNSNLKTHKIIKFSLPIYQKVKYDRDNHPEDRDCHWRLMILSMPTGGGSPVNVGPASQHMLSIQSVMLYNDL